MTESFSDRHGYGPPEPPITVREDAPPELRAAIPVFANEAGMKLFEIREVICEVLLDNPDPHNEAGTPNIWDEANSLIQNAPWPKVYDITEAIHFKLDYRDQWDCRPAEIFEMLLNWFFVEKGIGWELSDGKIIRRGSEIPDTPRYQVALSFAGEQRSYVEEVVRHLKSMRISLFYDNDERGYLWGKDYIETFHEVYANQSEYVVMFISKYYVEKAWTRHERRATLIRAFQERREYVLPVRFDDTPVPGLPDSVGFVQASDHSPKQISSMIAEKLSIKPFDSEVSDVQHPRIKET